MSPKTQATFPKAVARVAGVAVVRANQPTASAATKLAKLRAGLHQLCAKASTPSNGDSHSDAYRTVFC